MQCELCEGNGSAAAACPQERTRKNGERRHHRADSVTEPSDWCAPIVPVVKNKKSWKTIAGKGKDLQVRICIDDKILNKSIKREKYQLPIFKELIQKLVGSKFFSVLDASSIFWQLPLHETSRKLTPVGRFLMKRIPFGISIAPEVYQQRMHHLLDGYPGVICYIDDVLVHGATERDHDANLKRMMEIMKKGSLTLNMQKCLFKKRKIRYLGHEISEAGVTVDACKVEAINGLQKPANVKELKKLLGPRNDQLR